MTQRRPIVARLPKMLKKKMKGLVIIDCSVKQESLMQLLGLIQYMKINCQRLAEQRNVSKSAF